MTTRAGLAGLVTGLLLSGVLFYPLYVVWPGCYIENWPDTCWLPGIILAALAAALVVFGGGVAAAWGGASRPAQRVGLGALAGGLAGLVLFCTLGAAAAGVAGAGHGLAHMAENPSAAETLLRVTGWTHAVFWSLALGGIALGGAGGLWAAPAAQSGAGGAGPAMPLNATITAVPSAALAVILVMRVFGRLPAGEAGSVSVLSPQTVLDWPLGTALLLYLAAQLALTVVVPREARQATHRCAIDEVKMAAYVGIGVPLALMVILGVIDAPLAFTPFVLGGLLISAGMAARMVFVLFSLILPIRARMPLPRDHWEAVFFGTIAASRWQSLVLLCLGCGIVMTAPVYVAVAAAAINIAFISVSSSLGQAIPQELVRRLYLAHVMAGLGSSAAAALALTALYLFYLGLGKGFRWMRGAALRSRHY